VPPEAPKRQKEKDKKDAAEEKPKTEAKGDAAEKKEGKVKITVLDKTGKCFGSWTGRAAGVEPTKLGSAFGCPREPNPNNSSDRRGIWIGAARAARRAGEYTIKIKQETRSLAKVIVEEDTRIVISAADRSARTRND